MDDLDTMFTQVICELKLNHRRPNPVQALNWISRKRMSGGFDVGQKSAELSKTRQVQVESLLVEPLDDVHELTFCPADHENTQELQQPDPILHGFLRCHCRRPGARRIHKSAAPQFEGDHGPEL